MNCTLLSYEHIVFKLDAFHLSPRHTCMHVRKKNEVTNTRIFNGSRRKNEKKNEKYVVHYGMTGA